MIKKAIFLCAFALFSAAFAFEATVISVSGKVEMQDGGIWVALEEGDIIEQGAVISTGFKSQAVLEVKGSRFTLGPLTRATIENLLEESDKDSTQLFIDSGSVAADVNGANGKRVGFKVRSPIATASVRGTQFEFTASGRLSVSRGLVSFAPSSSKENANARSESRGVPVAAGQESKANATSGLCSSPATEKLRAASGAQNLTTTLASVESVGTTANSTTSAAVVPTTSSSTTSPKTATVNVTLQFD